MTLSPASSLVIYSPVGLNQVNQSKDLKFSRLTSAKKGARTVIVLIEPGEYRNILMRSGTAGVLLLNMYVLIVLRKFASRHPFYEGFIIDLNDF